MRTDLKIHVSGYYSYHLRRDGTAVIDRYTGSEDVLALPCQLDGFPVTGIGQEAFSDHREIKKVILPEGVKNVGRRAFNCCHKLKEIILPDSLTGMGKYVFEDCQALKEIRIPERVRNIGQGAFLGCSRLEMRSAMISCYFRFTSFTQRRTAPLFLLDFRRKTRYRKSR